MKSKKSIFFLCLIILGAVFSVIFNFGAFRADLKDHFDFSAEKEKKILPEERLNALLKFQQAFCIYTKALSSSSIKANDLYNKYLQLAPEDRNTLLEPTIMLIYIREIYKKKKYDELLLNKIISQMGTCHNCYGSKFFVCALCKGTGKCQLCDGTGTRKKHITTETVVRHDGLEYNRGVTRSYVRLCPVNCQDCRGKKFLKCDICAGTGIHIINCSTAFNFPQKRATIQKYLKENITLLQNKTRAAANNVKE